MKELDKEQDSIMSVNQQAKDMSSMTSREYEELISKKDTLVNLDKNLAKLHKQYLEEYNLILKEKQFFKDEIEKINLKSQSLHIPQ